MPKSPDAFRTISEVADWLGVQAHVLRFWESKFAQVKPIKRAGGRRYYRPADMLLLGGIKKLLHDDGLTIKGTQKLLREKGVAFVADQSQPLDDLTMGVIEGSTQDEVVTLEDTSAAELASSEPDVTVETETDAIEEAEPEEETSQTSDGIEDITRAETAPVAHHVQPEPVSDSPDAPPAETVAAAADIDADAPEEAPEVSDSAPEQLEEVTSEDTSLADQPEPKADTEQPMPSFRARARGVEPSTEQTQTVPEPGETPDADNTEPDGAPPTEQSEAPKPRVVDVPSVPPLSEIQVTPSALAAVARIRRLSPEHAREIKPHLARLTRLRASMANPRKEAHKD